MLGSPEGSNSELSPLATAPVLDWTRSPGLTSRPDPRTKIGPVFCLPTHRLRRSHTAPLFAGGGVSSRLEYIRIREPSPRIVDLLDACAALDSRQDSSISAGNVPDSRRAQLAHCVPAWCLCPGRVLVPARPNSSRLLDQPMNGLVSTRRLLNDVQWASRKMSTSGAE